MAAVIICSDFGAPKIKVWHCFHCFSIYFPWSDGTRCHDLRFLNVERLLISWLQSPSAVILEPPKRKSATVSPFICHEVMGPDAMILVFWMLIFMPTFSLSSFTFIKRLFSSSSLSAIRVVSSAYRRLLIFLPAVLLPACAYPAQCFSWCTVHIS